MSNLLRRPNTARWLALFLWLLVLLLYVAWAVSRGVGPAETADRLVAWLQTRPVAGPLLFIALYVVRPLFFFSASLLTVMAGFIFGPAEAVLYTVVGANLSATVAYVVGRYFGGLVTEATAGLGRLRSFGERLHRHSFESVLLMRLLFFPYDLVNYGAGLLRIRYGPFIMATILGTLPGTISFSLFGAAVEGPLQGRRPSLNVNILLASILIFVVTITLSRWLRRRDGGLWTTPAPLDEETPA